MKRTISKLLALAIVIGLLPINTLITMADDETSSNKYGYLFAYFTSASEEIRYALSKDGYYYTALNEDNPVITQTKGTGGARDPYILEGEDGTYYMIATDLKVSAVPSGQAWGANTSIITWSSTDLINWENETVIDIAGSYPGVTDSSTQTRVWAPEAIWDPDAGMYLVAWAMQNYSDSQLVLWYAYTKDFQTLETTPQVLYAPPTDNGDSNHDGIDVNIVAKDGEYYMFYKYGDTSGNNGYRVTKSTTGSAAGPYEEVHEGTTIITPAGHVVEGGDVYKLISQAGEEDTWMMIYDYYTSGSYGASISTDLENWTALDSEGFATLGFSPSHGYVIPITEDEFNTLATQWDTDLDILTKEEYLSRTPGNTAEEDWELSLAYDFEDVTGSTVTDVTGNGHDGILYGNATTSTENDSEVLSLDGSSGTYLQFPTGFFDGMDNMTISMDVKSNMSSGDFFTFTYGQDSTNYNFLRIRGTSVRNAITTGSWSTEEAVAATGASTGQWQNVTLVINEYYMSLYLDGALVDQNKSITTYTSDLGDNLLAYLGKSFYSPDSYFNGAFDNFKVYNYAMSEYQVADLYGCELSYDFEKVAGTTVTDVTYNGNDGTMYGSSTIATENDSSVLSLDGSSNTYLEFPQGFFDGRDTMTISMDVKSNMSSGNFFTFTYGQNDTVYDFLRIRGTAVRNAITTGSWGAEQDVSATGVSVGDWQDITLVIDGTKMSLYLDGVLEDVNESISISTTDLGSNLLAYLGKSFYSTDSYFNGAFDNVNVYNYAKSQKQIAEEFGTELTLLTGAQVGTGTPYGSVGADNHTATFTSLDYDSKTISSYVRSWTDLTDVDVTFTTLDSSVTITPASVSSFDLTEPKTITVTDGDTTEVWTIETPTIGNNSILQGQFADPDIDVFDGKYYIYPTTDGYSGWSGTQFKTFSSDDLVNWTDEGFILDVSNNYVNGEDNANGIPGVPWATGSAWAPTIEEKDGKYYFYFCAKDTSGVSAIGVAVADEPTGPFVAQDTPLLTMSMCSAAGVTMGQTIDPSIYTDPDTGISYMLFGNGSAAIVQLGDDMVSLVDGTMQNISGLTDFRESVIVTKVDGMYHFTWSCDDTGSEDYHVNYGTSTSLYGPVTYKYTLLQKNTSMGILGTGHHDILEIPQTDGSTDYYIVYARFVTPLNQTFSSGGLGNHRETCIEKLEYDESAGLLLTVTATHEGVSETYVPGYEPIPIDPIIDTTALEKAIEDAEYYYNNIDNYGDDDEASEFLEAYSDAKIALDALESQESVDTATTRLNAAVAALTPKSESSSEPPSESSSEPPSESSSEPPSESSSESPSEPSSEPSSDSPSEVSSESSSESPSEPSGELPSESQLSDASASAGEESNISESQSGSNSSNPTVVSSTGSSSGSGKVAKTGDITTISAFTLLSAGLIAVVLAKRKKQK